MFGGERLKKNLTFTICLILIGVVGLCLGFLITFTLNLYTGFNIIILAILLLAFTVFVFVLLKSKAKPSVAFKTICICLTIGCLFQILFSFISGWNINSRNFSINSPDGLFKLVVDGRSQNIILNIYNSSGKLLYHEKTNISSKFNWTAKWYGNTKFIINSTDTGPTEWAYQGNGTWKTNNPLYVTSPDGRTTLYIYWGTGKYLTIDVGKKINEYTFQTDQKIMTGLEVNDLIDCITWINNSQFVLKINNKNYKWQKEVGGNWKTVQ